MDFAKGIIQSIDYSDNKCVVRIPIFETAGTKSEFTSDAIVAVPPGIYNGYSAGDVVILGFGTGGLGDAVVVGKLYLGAAKEKAGAGGAVHCTDLTVSNSASLPSTVKLGFADGDVGTTVKTGNVKSIRSYSTLADLATAVAESEAAIDALTEGLESFSALDAECGTWINGETLYRRTVAIDGAGDAVVSAIMSTACWIDVGHSFIVKATGETTGIGEYSISKLNGNRISISGLGLEDGDVAYVTVIYCDTGD